MDIVTYICVVLPIRIKYNYDIFKQTQKTSQMEVAFHDGEENAYSQTP